MFNLDELLEMRFTLSCYSADEIDEALDTLRNSVENQMYSLKYDMKKAKEKYLQTDAVVGSYKGKKEKDYEIQRLAALEKLKSIEDPSEKIDFIMKTAHEIQEGVKFLSYNETFAECMRPKFMIDVCTNMFVKGATLTQIASYVPGAQMGDVYHLSERLGFKIPEFTEDEQRMVEEYDNRDPKNFTVNVVQQLREREFLPYYSTQHAGWEFPGDDEIYNTVETAKKLSGCEIKYPYFRGDSLNPEYTASYEEVLDELLHSPKKVHLNGLEEYYGSQEFNLFQKTKDKLLHLIEENEKKSE